MLILDFYKQFQCEEDCENYLKFKREKEGIVCPHCQCEKHYWSEKGKKWICRKCGHQTTLTAGTVMHSSNMPLMSWFQVIHFMTMTKGQISAAEVQRQLGHKRYQPIWEMVHKLRSVMGLRDDKHQLTGAIELDEGFFSVEPSDQSAKTQPLKRGNGSQRKAKVLVMVGSEEPGDEDKPKSGDKSRKLGYVRMKVIQDLQSNTICDAASEVVDKESEINMDDSKSHNKLEKVFPNSIKRVVEGKDAPTVLPWVHVSISRAKAMLLAVYHGVKDEYLQLYLDEFCWKLNRRYFGERTFDRLIIASVTNRPSFLHRMYSPEAQNKVLENCG